MCDPGGKPWENSPGLRNRLALKSLLCGNSGVGLVAAAGHRYSRSSDPRLSPSIILLLIKFILVGSMKRVHWESFVDLKIAQDIDYTPR
jgi:hypothetical protein